MTIVLDIPRILIEICLKVQSQVGSLIGTEEANESYGLGAGGDISKKIDIVAEHVVIDVLKNYGLKSIIVAEESGKVNITDGKNEGYIVVDALDGTTNALRGISFYCCSIAFADENRLSAIKHSIVMDLFSGDIYSATKGKGAFFNGVKIHVKEKFEESRYVVGMNVSGAEPQKIELLKPILSKSNHVRHMGANALELCIFARGLMDVFIDIRNKIRITDMAAAYLIVKEAGGILIAEDGKQLEADLDSDSRLSFIAAANRKVLDDIVETAGLKLQT